MIASACITKKWRELVTEVEAVRLIGRHAYDYQANDTAAALCTRTAALSSPPLHSSGI
jgi:hypothetical protein